MRQCNTAVGGDVPAHDHRIYVDGSFSIISARQPGPSGHAKCYCISLDFYVDKISNDKVVALLQ